MNNQSKKKCGELLPRVELGTSSLPRKCSTTELQQHVVFLRRGAEDGAQTRDPQLGRLVLYQLSYFRKQKEWAGTDSNRRSRKATDLQSACFNHLPTYPALFSSFLSLLSDSNQRPRDYKSRALAN